MPPGSKDRPNPLSVLVTCGAPCCGDCPRARWLPLAAGPSSFHGARAPRTPSRSPSSSEQPGLQTLVPGPVTPGGSDLRLYSLSTLMTWLGSAPAGSMGVSFWEPAVLGGGPPGAVPAAPCSNTYRLLTPPTPTPPRKRPLGPAGASRRLRPGHGGQRGGLRPAPRAISFLFCTRS